MEDPNNTPCVIQVYSPETMKEGPTGDSLGKDFREHSQMLNVCYIFTDLECKRPRFWLEFYSALFWTGFFHSKK